MMTCASLGPPAIDEAIEAASSDGRKALHDHSSLVMIEGRSSLTTTGTLSTIMKDDPWSVPPVSSARSDEVYMAEATAMATAEARMNEASRNETPDAREEAGCASSLKLRRLGSAGDAEQPTLGEERADPAPRERGEANLSEYGEDDAPRIAAPAAVLLRPVEATATRTELTLFGGVPRL